MFGGFKALSANFTPTPNQFFDDIVGHYPCRVVGVVAILIRSTLGWEDPDTGERQVEAELPLSAFLRPDLSESSARRGLAEAISAGLIVRTASASSRDGGRYALRWADGEAQARAIAKARWAARDPLLAEVNQGLLMESETREVRGVKSTPLDDEGRGVKMRGLKSTPPYRERNKNRSKRKSRKQTLNVGGELNSVLSVKSKGAATTAKTEPRSRHAEQLDREVQALVMELQDLGSERRHRQLLDICQEHSLDALPGEALQATRKRLAQEGRKGPLERPGAYYQQILIKKLEEQQVFVPKAAELAENDPGEVRRIARASLGLSVDGE